MEASWLEAVPFSSVSLTQMGGWLNPKKPGKIAHYLDVCSLCGHTSADQEINLIDSTIPAIPTAYIL